MNATDKLDPIFEWLNKNKTVPLLYTQKVALIFLIDQIDSNQKRKEKLRKSLKELMIKLLDNGTLYSIMEEVTCNETELREIISEMCDNPQKTGEATNRVTIDNWKGHKPTKFEKSSVVNDLSSHINELALFLIDNSPAQINRLKRFPALLSRIDSCNVGTLFEEQRKLFLEDATLLFEKDDIEYHPTDNSKEKLINGVKEVIIEWLENWQQLLLWVVSTNSGCRCILLGSSNFISIVGLEEDVNKVIELYSLHQKSITERADFYLYENKINSNGKDGLAHHNSFKYGSICGVSVSREVREMLTRNIVMDARINTYIFRRLPALRREYLVHKEISLNNINSDTIFCDAFLYFLS